MRFPCTSHRAGATAIATAFRTGAILATTAGTATMAGPGAPIATTTASPTGATTGTTGTMVGMTIGPGRVTIAGTGTITVTVTTAGADRSILRSSGCRAAGTDGATAMR